MACFQHGPLVLWYTSHELHHNSWSDALLGLTTKTVLYRALSPEQAYDKCCIMHGQLSQPQPDD